LQIVARAGSQAPPLRFPKSANVQEVSMFFDLSLEQLVVYRQHEGGETDHLVEKLRLLAEV